MYGMLSQLSVAFAREFYYLLAHITHTVRLLDSYIFYNIVTDCFTTSIAYWWTLGKVLKLRVNQRRKNVTIYTVSERVELLFSNDTTLSVERLNKGMSQ